MPDGFAITAIHLTLEAKIPGADQATFDKLVGVAKAGCPVSKVLKAEITLTATLLDGTFANLSKWPAEKVEAVRAVQPGRLSRRGRSVCWQCW